MNTIWDWLKGKKTYIVTALGLAYVVAQWWAGDMSQQDALTRGMELLGLSTVRHGIANS